MKKIANCPYCKSKISYLNMWLNHNHSSFRCNKCGYVSDILFSKQIRKNSILAVVISLIIFAVFIIIGNMKLWEIPIVLLPFLYFYYSLPYNMFLLGKPQPEKPIKTDKNPTQNLNQNDIVYKSKNNKNKVSDMTSVMPNINYYQKKYIPFDNQSYDISQTQKIDDLDLYLD